MEIINASESEYSDILIAVKVIKKAIIDSRFQLAKTVNKQVITLYYNIGCYISERSRKEQWGSGAIKTLSTLLQQELPGLRGFSETSIKDMRIFTRNGNAYLKIGNHQLPIYLSQYHLLTD